MKKYLYILYKKNQIIPQDKMLIDYCGDEKMIDAEGVFLTDDNKIMKENIILEVIVPYYKIKTVSLKIDKKRRDTNRAGHNSVFSLVKISSNSTEVLNGNQA